MVEQVSDEQLPDEPLSEPPRPAHVRRRDPVPSVGILPAVQSLLHVLIASLFLITFTVQPIRIPSASMEPTLQVGDFLLLDKQAVAPDPGFLPPSGIGRGDVIVFHDPVDDPSVHLVKRVVALPGDRLHLRDGVVFLNGRRLPEAYAVHRGGTRDAFRDDFPDLHSIDSGVNANWWAHLRGLVHDGDITVPPDSFFVMGDNRNNSEDSRYWGFVPRRLIVGKPVVVYFSWREPDPDNPESNAHVSGRAPGIVRWNRTFHVVQ